MLAQYEKFNALPNAKVYRFQFAGDVCMQQNVNFHELT